LGYGLADDRRRGAGAGREISAVRPDPHPAQLIIDVGSTRTKVALADGGGAVERIGSFPTRDGWDDALGAAIAGRVGAESGSGAASVSVEAIAVAAASRSFADRLRTWWTAHLGPPPPIRLVDPAAAPLEIDYRPPSALGADRVADAVAAVERWGAPVIVVDAGTAITCDLVSGDRRFAGGAIAPGPHTAYLSLVERVPHLGLARGMPTDGELPGVPASTYDAVRVGVLRGAAALVDSLVAGYRARVGAAQVIVTGGLGSLVASHCDSVTAVDPDLTLRGIALSCSTEAAEPDGRRVGSPPGGPRR
jgi:type III pantothenate kinase